MAKVKPMTKSQIMTKVAETCGVTKKEVAGIVEAVVQLAYNEAKKGFTVPGLGKLVVVARKARWGRNPATGEKIKIKAKDAIL
jgi:DNA-binding protein HU-beta